MPDTSQYFRAGRSLRRGLRTFSAWAAVLLVSTGCTTTSFVLGAVGVATDTSIPWSITKHLYAKWTEGDPVLCMNLNSVQRALSKRCGSFQPDSLLAADLANPELQECPLTIAAADPELWPVLPELIGKGASPERCHRAPLVALAQADACPAFAAASPQALESLRWLALADSRSVRHDVVRVLSCPGARAVGLDSVLDTWAANGVLAPEYLGFSVLGALHPDHLDSPLSRRLEAEGHIARAALGSSERTLSSGYEEALRLAHRPAVGWWLDRIPELANKVPASAENQVAWVPLAKVLVPNFLADPAEQQGMVEFLMSRGANPMQRLPHDPGMTVLSYARTVKSPHLALLDRPAVPAAPDKPAPLQQPRRKNLLASQTPQPDPVR